MADIVYDYANVPTVKRFSESRKFIRGLMGPFGSGKSSGCVIDLIKIASRQRPGLDGKRRARFAAIRNTYPQLSDTTIKTFHDWIPPHLFGKYNKVDHNYLITGLAPDLEIEVMFRALDRPEHVSNLLSLELTGAWVNEAREVPWAVIQALQGRVGRYPAVKDGGSVDSGIILDTNPPDTDSWFYKLFEEKKPDNAELFKQPSGLAPDAENKIFLPPNYYENLVNGADEDFIKVYVHGLYGFLKEGKPIYPEYNDALHCKDIEPVYGLTIYRGWDFGLMPACTFSQLLPDGRWNTFDELVGDTIGTETFANTVLDHTGRKYANYKFIDYGDPSGMSQNAGDIELKSHFDILHGKNIFVEGSEQSLEIRIGSVKRTLNTLVSGKPIMTVHSRCKMLRKGYQGRYQYRKLKIAGTEERYHSEPDKNDYSHPHDANQYVAAKLFGHLLKSANVKASPIVYPKSGII